MPTIFLDFDGVLFDTLKEAYVLCRHVCFGVDVFSPIDPDIYAKFFKFKFLVFNSWQYLYLMKSINTDDVVSSFNFYLENRDFDSEKRFEEKFLEKRQWLIKNHPDYVDSLETKFPFCDKIQTLDKNIFDILIVSRKNSFAIKRKGLDLKIIGKEELSNVVNKSEFIEKYMIDNNVKKAYFVDDNSHNLFPCKNIKNLTCILAGWGNIGINEIGLSQDDTIALLTS